jgi:hypothetical protein
MDTVGWVTLSNWFWCVLLNCVCCFWYTKQNDPTEFYRKNSKLMSKDISLHYNWISIVCSFNTFSWVYVSLPWWNTDHKSFNFRRKRTTHRRTLKTNQHVKIISWNIKFFILQYS